MVPEYEGTNGVQWRRPECRERDLSIPNQNGLWNQVDVEKYATPQGFQDNPQAVRDWYWERRMALPYAEPNEGHLT